MVTKFDIIINDATIIDGNGKPPFIGSIGISGNKISAIGKIDGDATEVVEGSGLTATPGFIDAHSHADRTLLWYPKCESFVMQGITTFVGGQCGSSPAPLGEMVRVPGLLGDYMEKYDPYKYYPKSLYPLKKVKEWMEQQFGFTVDWLTMRDYFKRVEEKGISANYAPLVGHGNIRFMVMGNDYKRSATQKEVEQMIELIHQSMKEGCLGMSTGMDYDPDVFASQDEIVQCVSVLKEYDAIYSPHWRRTGRRRDVKIGSRIPDRITGIKDSIEVCRKTHVPLHFAHFHDGYEINPKPYPPSLEKANAKATLELIDEVRAEGLDVTYDYIPVGGTHLRSLPFLCSLLAPWLRETGSPERLAEFLKMEDYRADIKDALFSGKWYIRLSYNPNANPHWAENIIVLKHKNQKNVEKSIAEIALMRKRDQFDTFLDLISEDPYSKASVVYHHLINPSREKEKVFLKHPAASISLDSIACDEKYQRESPPYSLPKNGTYDGFISILVRYVQEQKLLSIEEAITKMSTNAADAYNLKERGKLINGYYADIVLLDMSKLKVMSDGLEPRRYPRGVTYVFVNGNKVVEKGKHTGARSGKVLIRK